MIKQNTESFFEFHFQNQCLYKCNSDTLSLSFSILLMCVLQQDPQAQPNSTANPANELSNCEIQN